MQLFDYQEEALAKLPPSCIMAWGLGTGKTVSSLAHWERQGTGRPLLIVAPSAKIRTGDWELEAERWFGGNMPDITYISYEKLRLTDSKTRLPRWWQFCAKRNGGAVYDVIADEFHAVKSPKSKQSKAMLEIKQSGGLLIGLSGTPMPNGWIDFAGYSKIFGFTKGITEFNRRYCNIQTYKGYPEIIGYYNTHELQAQFNSIAGVLPRDETSLPDKHILPINIKMNDKSLKEYYTYKLKRIVPKTGEILDNSSRLASVLRQSTTASRLDSLLNIVNDTSDNVIIFYNYKSEREAILKLLSKTDKRVLRADGDKHDKLPASDANISDTILLAHYKSASEGLNLQWANVTVYFSPTYSYKEFDQSMGRTHRTGQSKKCIFYLFNVRNTLDKDVWDCIKDKKDFNDKLWEESLSKD